MRAHAMNASRRGHTLLEMLLAFTTMTVVLGGVVEIMHASRDAWRLTGVKSRMQESGRRMLESVLTDLRHSGLTSAAGGNYPAIWERPRGAVATPRGSLIATMNFNDEALVSEVLAYQGDGDHVARNSRRASDEIVFQLPSDLDHDGTPLDANGNLEWGSDLISYRVVDDAEGRPWLERDIERAGAIVARRMVGPSVTSITFDTVFNDRSLRYGTVDVVVYLEELDASGRRVRVAVEGSVALRNTLGS